MTKPIRNWLFSQGCLVKSEFPTPWGVCDLVGVRFDESRIRQRLTLGQHRAIGSLSRVTILTGLPDAETRLALSLRNIQVKYAYLLEPEIVEKELRALCEGGFVRRVRGAYQKLNGWMPLQKRIIAVELKLCRFSDVLNQARDNQEFTPESYVALPLNIANRIIETNKRKQLVEAGVGLLGVARKSCKILVTPAVDSSDANPVLQAYCVERFWRMG